MIEDDDIVEATGGARKTILGIGPRRMERVKHAFWAGLIALVMSILLLLDPIDQVLWLIESRMGSATPSGDIVFVQADAKATDPSAPAERVRLARMLDKLRTAGASKVYLNLMFEQPSSSRDDRVLARAIGAWHGNLLVVDRLQKSTGSDFSLAQSTSAVVGSQPRVVDGSYADYLGFAWHAPYLIKVGGKNFRSFEASLGGFEGSDTSEFQINYGYAQEKLPNYKIGEIETISKAGLKRIFYGKTLVIGSELSAAGDKVLIPGHWAAPPSYVAIYAAETLKSGGMRLIPGTLVVMAVLCALLANILFASRTRSRMTGYAVICLFPVMIFFASGFLRWRFEISYVLPIILIYGGIRSRARWKKRVALIDQGTGLPTLRALESRLAASMAPGHVIVAKIHGYENVLRTFASEDRSAYVLKLVDRLRATDSGLTVYVDGHNLAWYSKEEKDTDLVEHLEGLRAIFAAPVAVGGHSVDVGITFGASNLAGDRSKALAAALAAAEETSEAHQPIKLAENSTDNDQLWDISLRARIDDAMKAGEIFCVYQPKMDMSTNRLVGVEALVRWQDPVKGFISPLHFIMQCEKAGRMEHLTRYVLQSACSAGQLLHFRGHEITMSVNISATLLNDMRIVGIVRNVLQATGFSPTHLVLEITETARVGDFETAEVILNQLKALGAKISMDDFGVGAANFEALHALPFDEVKIDRQFVADAVRNPKARAIVSSIVALGRESRITVVAEGAESAKELQMLELIGCTHVQGYAISKPVSLTNLMEKFVIPLEAQQKNMV